MFYVPLDTDDKGLLRRQERLERHARDLREMAEVGMMLTRLTLRHRYTAEAEPGVLGDLSLSFARVSRAVRQTMAQETDIEEAIINLENPAEDRAAADGRNSERPTPDRSTPEQAPRDHSAVSINRPAKPLTPAAITAQVKAIIGGGIVANAPRERRENLLGELDDYLDDHRLQADFNRLTFNEIIARIAKDLCCAPAEGGTGVDPAAKRPTWRVEDRCSSLAALARLAQQPTPRSIEAAWGLPRDG